MNANNKRPRSSSPSAPSQAAEPAEERPATRPRLDEAGPAVAVVSLSQDPDQEAEQDPAAQMDEFIQDEYRSVPPPAEAEQVVVQSGTGEGVQQSTQTQSEQAESEADGAFADFIHGTDYEAPVVSAQESTAGQGEVAQDAHIGVGTEAAVPQEPEPAAMGDPPEPFPAYPDASEQDAEGEPESSGVAEQVEVGADAGQEQPANDGPGDGADPAQPEYAEGEGAEAGSSGTAEGHAEATGEGDPAQPVEGEGEVEGEAYIAAEGEEQVEQEQVYDEAGAEGAAMDVDGQGTSEPQPDYNAQLQMLVAQLAAQQEQAQAEAEAYAQAQEGEGYVEEGAEGMEGVVYEEPPLAPAEEIPASAPLQVQRPPKQKKTAAPKPPKPPKPPKAPKPPPAPKVPTQRDIERDQERARERERDRERIRAATPRKPLRPAPPGSVNQTLVLQILTSLTSISSLTGIDLNSLTRTLVPSLDVPAGAPAPAVPGAVGAPPLVNPLISLLAQFPKIGLDENDDGGSGTEGPDDDNDEGAYPGESAADRKERRRRNRMTLSCTECHRRKQHCDRKIPCGRCIKRGVASLCQVETPILQPTKKEKAAESSVQVGLTLDTANKIFALENVLRSDPSILHTLEGAGFNLGSLLGASTDRSQASLHSSRSATGPEMATSTLGPATAGSSSETATAPVASAAASALGSAADSTQDAANADKTAVRDPTAPVGGDQVTEAANSQDKTNVQESGPVVAPAEPSVAPISEIVESGTDGDANEPAIPEPGTTLEAASGVAANDQAATPQAEGEVKSGDEAGASSAAAATEAPEGPTVTAPSDAAAARPAIDPALAGADATASVDDPELVAALPAEAPQDEAQAQQRQEEEDDDQNKAQLSQQADAAALIAQLSQSLMANQNAGQPSQAAPGSAASGFAPILTNGAVPAPAEADGQGTLLMDVLQHLSGAPGKNNAAAFLNNLLSSAPQYASNADLWTQIPPAMPETGVQVQMAFETDSSPRKLNLGLTGFREDDGKLFMPPTVRQIERKLYMQGQLTHRMLPIEGFRPFLDAGMRFAYGTQGQAWKDHRIAAVQAVSITGALRLGGTFLSRHPSHPPVKAIYIPNPTTEEEAWALKDSGLDIRLYRFLDRRTGGVDWEGMREDLQNAPAKSLVLIHVSGSTPTGAELSLAQWRILTEIIKVNQHVPFMVMEYQGLSSGDAEKDAQPLRFMAHEGMPLLLAQSFDSSMGLYSDSPTLLSVVASSTNEKNKIESQLKSMARAMHSHPPPWGAVVAANILADPIVNNAWLMEVKAMSERLRSIREKLYDQLTNKLKTPGNWGHFRKSSGMYSTAKLTPAQLQRLGQRQHIHLLPDGCFSLGCLNAAKIEQLAAAMDKVVRGVDEMDVVA